MLWMQVSASYLQKCIRTRFVFIYLVVCLLILFSDG